MIRPGLDVHCCRSRLAIADGWHLVHGQYIRPGWQPSAIAVTLCHSTYGPAVDLQTESQVPSEIRHSVNNKTTRRVMIIRPKVTRPPLCNGSGANCADKTKSPKKVPREAVFWFHNRDHTPRSGFSPAADASNFHHLLNSRSVRLDQFDSRSIGNARNARESQVYRRRASKSEAATRIDSEWNKLRGPGERAPTRLSTKARWQAVPSTLNYLIVTSANLSPEVLRRAI
jgi:hypothetical protein